VLKSRQSRCLLLKKFAQSTWKSLKFVASSVSHSRVPRHFVRISLRVSVPYRSAHTSEGRRRTHFHFPRRNSIHYGRPNCENPAAKLHPQFYKRAQEMAEQFDNFNKSYERLQKYCTLRCVVARNFPQRSRKINFIYPHSSRVQRVALSRKRTVRFRFSIRYRIRSNKPPRILYTEDETRPPP
jgi:hypothetical protein